MTAEPFLKTAKQKNVLQWQAYAHYRPTGDALLCISWSADGTKLVVGSDDFSARILAVNNGAEITTLNGHNGSVWCCAFSSSGHRVVTGSDDNTLRLWSSEGIELGSLVGHSGTVFAVSFFSGDKRIVSASYDGSVRLWDADSATEIARLTEHKTFVYDAAVSSDDRHIVSGARDGIILIWDIDNRTSIQQLVGHRSAVTAVAFSPDGIKVVSGSNDKTIRLWHVKSGAELARFTGHLGRVNSVAFSPNGQYLASASNDTTIRLWDIKAKSEIACLTSGTNWIWRIAFSPDGRNLASVSRDGTLCIWDTSDLAHPPTLIINNSLENWLVKQCLSLGCAVDLGIQALKNTKTPDPTEETIQIEHKAGVPHPARFLKLRAEGTPSNIKFFLQLARVWEILYKLNIAAPISFIPDLLNLLSGNTPAPLRYIQSHPSLEALRHLHWHEQANIGIVVLILYNWPGCDEWQAPSNTETTDLRQALTEALFNSDPCEPEPVTLPISWLTQAMAQIDDRLITLLTAIGANAVAADPGLILRLLPQLIHLPRLIHVGCEVLTLRLSEQAAGVAQSTGAGQDHSGVTTHGSIASLVKSQWAYPRHLLDWFHVNGSLLYRTRSCPEAPKPPPMVLLLDTSPACWGLVEAITRPAAHAIAERLAQENRTIVLLTASDGQVSSLDHPSERLKLLTHRSQQPANIPTALMKAQALRSKLSDGFGDAIIILLTHCWWGADLANNTHQPWLRALFVQYPSTTIHPPFAPQCERWETMRHNQFDDLMAVMGRLIL